MDYFIMMMVDAVIQILHMLVKASIQIAKAIQHARKQAKKQHTISPAAIRIAMLQRKQSTVHRLRGNLFL